VTCN
jgi:hypothetical protein